MKTIVLLLMILIFASCEKKESNQEKETDKVILLKSVNFHSKEILTIEYDNQRVRNFKVLKDVSHGYYDFDYNFNYILKFDFYYKSDGKFDKVIRRGIDTVVYSSNTESHFSQSEAIFYAVYNNSNNFCGFREGTNQMLTFQFDSKNRVQSGALGELRSNFEYDSNGNMSVISNYTGTRLTSKREYEFDSKKNPFYILYPYWGMFVVDWPPAYHYYACMSPNNPTRVQITGQPNEVINYQYQYGDNMYPSKCTVSKAAANDLVFSFTYY